MSEPDPTADTAHECLGVAPDASRQTVKLAAARAKSEFNPDNYPAGEKRAARTRFHVVSAAEDALLADGEFPPERITPPAPETLSVTAARDRLTADESVTVSVTVDDTPADEGVVRAAETTAEIADGRATLSLAEAGERTLTAVVGDRTATTTVTVTPPAGGVGLELGRTTVRAGEPLRVAVRRQSDGRLVSDATVAAADGRSWTATDGRVRIRPTEPGQLQLTATRDTESVSSTDTRTVTVVPASVELALSAPETVATGEQFTVSARESTGEPAAGVQLTVRRDGDTVTQTTTDDRGQTRLTLDHPGTYKLHASDDRPETAVVSTSRELTVRATTTALAVEVIDTPTATNPRCRLLVRDEWGRRVSDATVTVGDRTTTTDDRGRATVTVADGEEELLVTHPTDRRTRTTLTVGGSR
jgi:hypothetical protein